MDAWVQRFGRDWLPYRSGIGDGTLMPPWRSVPDRVTTIPRSPL
jgi:hypothetical protein